MPFLEGYANKTSPLTKQDYSSFALDSATWLDPQGFHLGVARADLQGQTVLSEVARRNMHDLSLDMAVSCGLCINTVSVTCQLLKLQMQALPCSQTKRSISKIKTPNAKQIPLWNVVVWVMTSILPYLFRFKLTVQGSRLQRKFSNHLQSHGVLNHSTTFNLHRRENEYHLVL